MNRPLLNQFPRQLEKNYARTVIPTERRTEPNTEIDISFWDKFDTTLYRNILIQRRIKDVNNLVESVVLSNSN